jgi:hypothetical protein
MRPMQREAWLDTASGHSDGDRVYENSEESKPEVEEGQNESMLYFRKRSTLICAAGHARLQRVLIARACRCCFQRMKVSLFLHGSPALAPKNPSAEAASKVVAVFQ